MNIKYKKIIEVTITCTKEEVGAAFDFLRRNGYRVSSSYSVYKGGAYSHKKIRAHKLKPKKTTKKTWYCGYHPDGL